MRRWSRVASLLVVGALVTGCIAAGCGDYDNGGGDVGELKVGVLVPLTGDLAPSGGPGARAADLAASTVNAAAGDTGLRLTLVQEDTRTDAQASQEAATKLIESSGVSAIAGPWATSELVPTAENVTIAAGIPVVSPFSTFPTVTDLEDDGLVFRTAPSDALQGRVIARLVARELGADATVVTASRDDTYGIALVEAFTTTFEAAGGTVSKNVSYNPEATSLNSKAQQIAGGDPDGWMIIDLPESWARMGPALVRTGNWDPAKTFTGDGLRNSTLPAEMGEEATEGMRGSAPTSLEAPAGAAFDALWTSEVGDSRQNYDAQSFDAVIVIALAAAAAGSSDSAAIAENLQAVSGPPGNRYTFEQLEQAFQAAADGADIDYEGASGPIDFDDNGDPNAASYGTWSYTDGKLVDTDEVIPFTSSAVPARAGMGR